MKQRIICALLLVLALCALAAEDQPQIAYRILNGFLVKQEAEGAKARRGAGIALTTAGGSLVAGAAVTYFAGDAIGEACFGGPMDSGTKAEVSLGLGIGGLATAIIGVGILSAGPRDYYADYAEVFSESDYAVREALAVAVLKDLAVSGRRERMTSAIVNLAAPFVYGAIRACVNEAQGDPWSKDIAEGVYWTAGNMITGISSLLATSEKERLYEKYLAGRDALYGDRPER